MGGIGEKAWHALLEEAKKVCVREATDGLDEERRRWAQRRQTWKATKGLEIISDSQPVAAWFKPGGSVQGLEPTRRMKVAWDTVEDLARAGWGPRLPDVQYVQWVPRCLTAGPDLLANMTMDLMHSLVWLRPDGWRPHANPEQRVRFIGDGAARANEPRSAFALILVAYAADGTMTVLGFYTKCYPRRHDAWEMEIEAVLHALKMAALWHDDVLWERMEAMGSQDRGLGRHDVWTGRLECKDKCGSSNSQHVEVTQLDTSLTYHACAWGRRLNPFFLTFVQFDFMAT